MWLQNRNRRGAALAKSAAVDRWSPQHSGRGSWWWRRLIFLSACLAPTASVLGVVQKPTLYPVPHRDARGRIAFVWR